jgi:hypothetical protein
MLGSFLPGGGGRGGGGAGGNDLNIVCT